MIFVKQIYERIKKAKRNLLVFACLLLLCACDDCPTYQEFKSSGIGSNCLLCPLFDVLRKSASDIANQSWNTFAKDLSLVVVFVTAIYVAFFTLKMVGSFGKQAFADYLMNDKKGVLMLGFKLAVIMLLLNSTFFIDNILSPVLQSGLIIGQTLSTASSVNISWATGGAGWDALFNMIYEAAKDFNDQVYEHIALGKAMVCHATKGFILTWYWLLLFYGLIFFLFGWYLLACVSFFIVDMLINLAIGAVLLPFGIAFAISAKTMGYAKKIWQIFLGVFFNFVMLGVVLGLSVQMIELAMGRMDPSMAPSVGINSFLGEVSALLDANNVKQVSEIMWNSGCILLAIACFWLVSKLIDQIKELAYKISDALGKDLLSSSGTQVGAVIVGKATSVGKKVGGYAKDTAKHGADVFSRATRIDKGLNYLSSRATTIRGIVTGTGKEGYKAWWRQ